MPEGLVPRMAIEWGFLILLAVGAAVADLSPVLIILVMAVGWVLVVLVELLAWRARPGYAVTEPVAQPPPEAVVPPPVYEEPLLEAPVVEAPPPPPPAVVDRPAEAPGGPAYDFEFTPPGAPAPTAEESTDVLETAAEEAERKLVFAPEEEDGPLLDPDDPFAPAPERDRLRRADQRVVHRLEPLKPRPRRRLFRRDPGDRGSGGEGV